MLEDILEETFPGIRFSRKVKLEDAKQKRRVLVQVPLMVRLAREGTVALGDVFSPCVALASVPLPGKPALVVDVIVLDAEGGVAVVECRQQAKGVHADGAARLARIHGKLKGMKTRRALESAYRAMLARSHAREKLADLPFRYWTDVTETSADRAMDAWLRNMSAGNVALYLATERRPADRPGVKADPITPMQKLLEKRAGGVLQVEPPASSPRPHARYVEALEEPARIIWTYRRMVTT